MQIDRALYPGPMAWALALYGPQQVVSVSTAISWLQALLDRFRLDPEATEFSLVGTDKTWRTRWPKIVVDYRNDHDSELKYLSLYPSHKQFEMLGYSEFDLSVRSPVFGMSIVIREELAPILSEICDIVKRATCGFQIGYGFCARIPFSASPGYYLRGLCWTDAERRTFEERNVSAFFRSDVTDQRYLSAAVRDLYETNVLSAAHLSIPVEGVELLEVIRMEGIGRLEQLACGLTIWFLEPEEIDAVRPRLLKAGALIAVV
jgi:hypothetical protein